MSDTIHLACLTCRVELWIGQGGYSPQANAYLYGEERDRAAFQAFYDAHPPNDGHDIRLTNLEGLYDLADEWREFGDDEVHGRPTEGTGYLGLKPKVKIRHDTSIIPDSWATMKPGHIRLKGDYFDLTEPKP